MESQVMIARYQAMVQLRVHFGRLYFQVVAFCWALAVAILGLWGFQPAACAGAALALLAGAFVAQRLLARERSCFVEMQTIWGALTVGQDSGASVRRSRPGAMYIVVLGQVGLAVLLGLGALWPMFS